MESPRDVTTCLVCVLGFVIALAEVTSPNSSDVSYHHNLTSGRNLTSADVSHNLPSLKSGQNNTARFKGQDPSADLNRQNHTIPGKSRDRFYVSTKGGVSHRITDGGATDRLTKGSVSSRLNTGSDFDETKRPDLEDKRSSPRLVSDRPVQEPDTASLALTLQTQDNESPAERPAEAEAQAQPTAVAVEPGNSRMALRRNSGFGDEKHRTSHDDVSENSRSRDISAYARLLNARGRSVRTSIDTVSYTHLTLPTMAVV